MAPMPVRRLRPLGSAIVEDDVKRRYYKGAIRNVGSELRGGVLCRSLHIRHSMPRRRLFWGQNCGLQTRARSISYGPNMRFRVQPCDDTSGSPSQKTLSVPESSIRSVSEIRAVPGPKKISRLSASAVEAISGFGNLLQSISVREAMQGSYKCGLQPIERDMSNI